MSEEALATKTVPDTAEVIEKKQPTLAELADKAAYEFKTMLPVFKRYIPTLSNKAKDRVIKAILEFPLWDNEPIFQSDREKDLFDLGLRLIDAKTVMIQAAYEERIKKELEENKNEQPKEASVNE